MFRTVPTLALLCCVIFAVSSGAQDTSPTQPAGGTEPTKTSPEARESIEALQSVLESIQLVDRDLTATRRQLESTDEVEKEGLQAKILSLIEKKAELESDFESIATGVDPAAYNAEIGEEFVLSREVDVLLEPLIGELKELTEKPREIEQLRSDLDTWEKRQQTAAEALTRISTLPTDEVSDALRREIADTSAVWQERRQQAANRVQALRYQLEQAEASQPSLLDAARDGLRTFYRSRGRNFLFTVLTFFGVLFLLRFLHQRLERHFPWKRDRKRPVYLRLIDVGFNLLSVVGAIIASLLVLYATGDWVLMGLAIIVLIAVALAAKNTLPKFFDQARLLLNLGEIREGERVVYNGIPWTVERLSFYTILRNEELRGGMVRLPVGQLSGLVSRPPSTEGEIYFPCREGDWLRHPDHGLARVVSQSPEFVQLVKLGGAKLAVPTADFLSSAVTNLTPGFRISMLFGLDYDHQPDITTTIPEKMWAFLTREICTLIGDRELLSSLKVEFASAGASSLDLAIIADFDGSLAAKYQVLERAIQRFAVDCCNENGWVIPFTQITLHNAYPSEKPKTVEEKPKAPKLP